MDDAMEAEVLRSVLVSHSQLASRAAATMWGWLLLLLDWLLLFLEMHVLRPQMVAVLVTVGLLTLLINDRCFECVSHVARAVASRLRVLSGRPAQQMAQALCGDTAAELWRGRYGHACAIQGVRATMEDRFAAEEDMLLPGGQGTSVRGLSIYGVFDGHGGDFAAEYTKHHLIPAFKAKLQEVHAQRGTPSDSAESGDTESANGTASGTADPGPDSTVTSTSTADPGPDITVTSTSTADPGPDITVTSTSTADPGPDITVTSTADVRASPLSTEPADEAPLRSCKSHEAYQRPRARRPDAARTSPQADMLVDFFGQINYTKVLQAVFAEVDTALLESARRDSCIAGTTAVVALVDGDQVVVASCGDSRAVLCDARGNAVPLSIDHKPDQLSEKKRITEAGGFVTFNGVWRVNGILATSRALGDLPFKERGLLTCRPDVQTVSVRHHAAPFLLLASDGLWDAASGQEAVQHVRTRLHEPDLGARSLTMLAYQRGSLDNITVLIVDLRPGQLGRTGSCRRPAVS